MHTHVNANTGHGPRESPPTNTRSSPPPPTTERRTTMKLDNRNHRSTASDARRGARHAGGDVHEERRTAGRALS
jgi:hypothetical protein